MCDIPINPKIPHAVNEYGRPKENFPKTNSKSVKNATIRYSTPIVRIIS